MTERRRSNARERVALYPAADAVGGRINSVEKRGPISGAEAIDLRRRLLTSTIGLKAEDSLRAAHGTRSTRAGSCFTETAHRCTRPGLTVSPQAFHVSASPAATTGLCLSRRFGASGFTLRPAHADVTSSVRHHVGVNGSLTPHDHGED